jgi:small-conductance mechanosensitive channel
MTRAREHDWLVGIGAGLLATAALVAGSEFGTFHGSTLDPKLIAWIAAAVLLVAGVVATRRIAAGLGNVVPLRSSPAAGAAVRLLATGVGYIMLVFAVFAVLGVSIQHLLIGAGLIGIVVGIAAQQSLGNIFASVVLLFARPFGVGDRIRIRSGALGGVFDVSVLGIGLTYVTVRTDEGELKIPNSAMLAAGVGQLPPAPATPVSRADEVAAPRDEGGHSMNLT